MFSAYSRIASVAVAFFAAIPSSGDAQQSCATVLANASGGGQGTGAAGVADFTGEEDFFEKFDVSERVADGSEALVSNGAVSLRLQYGWTRSGRCTGSLISDRWVLTAAHCLFTRDEKRAATEVLVYYDSLKTWKGKNVAGQAFCHNAYGFRNGGFLNDIAVIKLDAPLPNATKLKLVRSGDTPMRNRSSGTIFDAYGHGQLKPGEETDRLMVGRLRTRESNQACLAHQNAGTKVFCSHSKGTSAAPSSLCPGDSGGPAIVSEGATLRQVGINSYVYNVSGGNLVCGRDGNFAGFTEVHSYLGWIRGVTGDNGL